jgi:hypothetical protein
MLVILVYPIELEEDVYSFGIVHFGHLAKVLEGGRLQVVVTVHKNHDGPVSSLLQDLPSVRRRCTQRGGSKE